MELDCIDGIDDDCDGSIDCADADCAGDVACVCALAGTTCTSGQECCSGKCKGKPGRRTCN